MIAPTLIEVVFFAAWAVMWVSLTPIVQWLRNRRLVAQDANCQRVSRDYGHRERRALGVFKHGAQHRRTNDRVEDAEADPSHADPDEQYKPESSRVNHEPILSIGKVTRCGACGNLTRVNDWCAWCER